MENFAAPAMVLAFGIVWFLIFVLEDIMETRSKNAVKIAELNAKAASDTQRAAEANLELERLKSVRERE